jgi:hypothetical protein
MLILQIYKHPIGREVSKYKDTLLTERTKIREEEKRCKTLETRI